MTHRCCLICDRHETLNCPVDAFGTAWSVSTNYCCHYKEKTSENIHIEIIDELLNIPGMNTALAGRVVASIDLGLIPHCSITY